jgi:hypothetical protein
LLKVSPHIVKVELKRGDHLKHLPDVLKQPKTFSTKKKKINTARIKRWRSDWKKVMKANPEAGRSQLGQICGRQVYHLLLAHDREWFEINSPPRQLSNGTSCRTRWKQRDPELAAFARQAAINMTSASGRPVRASASAIARLLGVLSVVHRRAYLLPLTIEAISNSAEGVEEYAIRRIRWCAECYANEGVMPRLHQLQIRAGLSSKIWKSSTKIRDAMSAIIQNF